MKFGDKITLEVEAILCAGRDIPRGYLNFTVGAVDFFENEEDKGTFKKSIGSVCGVLGGKGGVQISVRETGHVFHIDAPTLWLALLKALEEQ